MSEWVEETIGDVTVYQKAGGTPTASESKYYGGEVPFVVIEDMTRVTKYLESTEKSITHHALSVSAAWLIQEPHVLYSMYATVGKPVINRIPCATNQAIIALKENNKVIQDYLFYTLEFIRPIVWKYTSQTTQANLNASVVRRLPVKYPLDIFIQKKIANILQTIDEAIEKTEQLIEKYQQIKAGLMHDLFTRGIGVDGKLRPPREQAPELYWESPIGWIPKDWECIKLEDLLDKVPNNLRSGPFGSALLKAELVEDGIPFLGIDNIYIEKFDDDFRRFVSERKFNELSKYAVRKGDVIITIMGTVGRAAVVPSSVERALSSKHLWTMTFDGNRVIPELICWQLNFSSWVKSWFRRETQGGIMDAIQSKTLRALRLPVPCFDEQKRIHERYVYLTSKLRQEELLVEKLRKQKSGLMHDLLTGNVSVSADLPVEPASPEEGAA